MDPSSPDPGSGTYDIRVSNPDQARMILELSDWGRMYAAIVEDYDDSKSADPQAEAIEELQRLREQLWICEFETMDESEQIEALLSLGTLEMDYAALGELSAIELAETLDQDIAGDISRWDRLGQSTAEDRHRWREAIWQRLATIYPQLAPPEKRPPEQRLRDLPDEPSGILF